MKHLTQISQITPPFISSMRQRVIDTLRDNERSHMIWAFNDTGWKIGGQRGTAELLDSILPRWLFEWKNWASSVPEVFLKGEALIDLRGQSGYSRMSII